MTLDRELPLTYPGDSYANRTPHGFHATCGFCRIARSGVQIMIRLESDHDLILLFEHDLFGKPVPTFPDHALAVEKFHQLRDHLVRRFFHQPVSAIPNQHTLDIGRHHLPCSIRNGPPAFSPDSTSSGIDSLVLANPAKSSASVGKARKTSMPAFMWPGWT